MYFIYGIDEYLIKTKINEILNEHNLTNIDTTTYEFDDNLSDIINDASTISLFTSKKAIIVNNANIFKSGINTEILEKYIENPNLDTILIFVLKEEKLDERRKITKLLRTKTKVLELNKANINSVVKDMFKGYKIDNNTIDYFIKRVGDNLLILENESIKLKLYKEDKNISIDDIDELITKNIDIDLFKLIDAIISKDKDTAITIYNEMLKQKEEPIAIIITLANQIRIMYQTKELYKLGYRENEIASILNIHPFRVKKAHEKNSKYSSNTLLKLLNNLATLDLNIKKGLVDKTIALELFILQI